MAKFTPTQQRIMDVLADGKPHHKSELHECLFDDMAVDKDDSVSKHIIQIRKKLNPDGYDIVTNMRNRKCYYMHVRLLSTSSYDGK